MGPLLIDLDGLLERSKSRPLASGAISMTGAFALFAAHYVALYYLLTLTGDEGYFMVFHQIAGRNPNFWAVSKLVSWACTSLTSSILS